MVTKPQSVRAGDVFRDPKDGAATVMRVNPGGVVMLRIERGEKVLVGDARVRDLKQWDRLGRADSVSGAYLSALPLLTAGKSARVEWPAAMVPPLKAPDTED